MNTWYIEFAVKCYEILISNVLKCVAIFNNGLNNMKSLIDNRFRPISTKWENTNEHKIVSKISCYKPYKSTIVWYISQLSISLTICLLLNVVCVIFLYFQILLAFDFTHSKFSNNYIYRFFHWETEIICYISDDVICIPVTVDIVFHLFSKLYLIKH